MNHTLTLTNAGRVLVADMLRAPDVYANAADLLRGGRLLNMIAMAEVPKPITDEWAKDGDYSYEITEKQRDLLKHVVGKLVGKIPAGPHVVSLLEQLGFEE